VLTDELTDENKIVNEGVKTCKEFGIDCNIIKAKIAGGVKVERCN
ncbi:homoserine kinase, partial [Sulfolobus sp. A20-N-G8]